MSALQLPPRPWPKLSETLTGPRDPCRCQSCGCGAKGAVFTRWQEADENDHPTATLVVLCSLCAERLIEAHPRLYRRLDANLPVPGAMPHLCPGCRHLDGLTCRHPDLKSNGGAGLKITVAPPIRGFIDRRDPKTDRRTGGVFERYEHPASACAGRETA